MNFKALLVLCSFFLLPISLVSAESIENDIGSEDLYFYTNVFISGVEQPGDMGANDGVSTLSLEGTGSLTLINKKISSDGDLRFTLFGGTDIASRRIWNGEFTKTWWDGTLPSPAVIQKPSLDDITFSSSTFSPDSRKLVYGAYGMGTSNEEFSFSQPAMFVFPVTKPAGTKIWIARKGVDENKWSTGADDFCIIEDEVCITPISSISTIALIEQLYAKCPSVPKNVMNGTFVGAPTCSIQCYSGYRLDDSYNSCVKSEGTLGGGGEAYRVRPGYFRLTEARSQVDRRFDLDVSLTGDMKTDKRLRVQNITTRKTVRENTNKITERQKALANENGDTNKTIGDDSGFMNYLLEIRNAFSPNNNVFSETTIIDDENDLSGIIDNKNALSDDVAAPPTLPKTGSGTFLTLIIIGIAVMIFARRRHI